MALKIMSSGYNSKIFTFPGLKLQQILLYKEIDKIRIDCELFGLVFTNQNILFQKANFKDEIKLVSNRISSIIKFQNVIQYIIFNDIKKKKLLCYSVYYFRHIQKCIMRIIIYIIFYHKFYLNPCIEHIKNIMHLDSYIFVIFLCINRYINNQISNNR